MSDDVDTTGCLTKAQAAQALGTSTKGIERAVQAGELVQHWRRQPGTPDVAVYFPDEVAALKAKRAQERRRGPSGGVLVTGPAVGSANGNGNGHQAGTAGREGLAPLSPFPAPMITPREDWLALVIAAAQRIVSQTSETSQTDTPWLTVDEAAAWSGLTAFDLRKMIRRGELPCRHKERRDWRTWRIRRKDLEAL